MSQSSWILSEPQVYQVPKILIDEQIQKVLQNIRKSGQEQAQIELKFKRQSDLQKFLKIYEQQVNQDQYDYMGDEKSQQENKFKKCKDIDEKDFQVRQLAFPSFHFVNIFMKIYEIRLKQLQTEYQYRFFVHRNKFRVYFPKGQKISSFFKNQIFEMKTKLNLYYSNDQIVIDKIKYSAYFNSLIEKQSIAAEYHKRLNKVDVAIFYSNTHQKKNIIQIVRKNLLQHMTILDSMDKNLKTQTNHVLFKLLYSLLFDKIKIIQKNNDTIIQTNNQRCCILIHDKHQCFVDAKNQTLTAIKNTISFKLDGKDMRTLCNKVLRNHQKYPYLRVKYSHRSLYCVIDLPLLESKIKHITTFVQFLLVYFQSLNQENKISLFPKLGNYSEFLDFYFKVAEDKNITILNFNEFTMNKGYQISKIKLGVKDIGQLNIVKTRREFFQVFLQLILKTTKVNHILQSVYAKFDDYQGVIGFLDLSQCFTLLSQSLSQTTKSQTQSNFEKQNHNVQQKNSEQKLENSQKMISKSQNVPQLINRASSYKYKQRQKKPKHLDISFDFKPPQIDTQQSLFWNNNTRQRKLQKLLSEKYRQFFGELKFKIYKLALKQKINLPQIQELEKDRIYISTTIEKNSEICHHLIDLNEFSKLCNEVKHKTFFIFYKLATQQVYLPSFTLALI